MTKRPTYPKSTCCIPGCTRWSRKFPGEWLCGRHWGMVPRRCRRALNKVWKARHDLWAFDAATPRSQVHEDELKLWRRLDRLAERLWAHARRAVILRDAGL